MAKKTSKPILTASVAPPQAGSNTYIVRAEKQTHIIVADSWSVSSAGLVFFKGGTNERKHIAWFTTFDWWKLANPTRLDALLGPEISKPTPVVTKLKTVGKGSPLLSYTTKMLPTKHVSLLRRA